MNEVIDSRMEQTYLFMNKALSTHSIGWYCCFTTPGGEYNTWYEMKMLDQFDFKFRIFFFLFVL